MNSDNLLNSKGEYNRCQLPRLGVKMGERVIENEKESREMTENEIYLAVRENHKRKDIETDQPVNKKRRTKKEWGKPEKKAPEKRKSENQLKEISGKIPRLTLEQASSPGQQPECNHLGLVQASSPVSGQHPQCHLPTLVQASSSDPGQLLGCHLPVVVQARSPGQQPEDQCPVLVQASSPCQQLVWEPSCALLTAQASDASKVQPNQRYEADSRSQSVSLAFNKSDQANLGIVKEDDKSEDYRSSLMSKRLQAKDSSCNKEFMVSKINLPSNIKSKNENVNSSKFKFTPTNKSIRTLIEMFENSPKTSRTTISKPGPPSSTTHRIATATTTHETKPAKQTKNRASAPTNRTQGKQKRKPVLPTGFKYRKISDHFEIRGRRPDQPIKESDQANKPTQSKFEVSC